MAEAHNFDVILANGEENMDKQIADIETMLLKSPDVIIIHNSENTGIIPTLYKIEKRISLAFWSISRLMKNTKTCATPSSQTAWRNISPF